MYAFPVDLPQTSNREDLLLTVSLFDDDTGLPVKLDGTTTASPVPFTSAAWTVSDGAISTTSATSITIPVYPIGSQLSALAIAVGASLGILPGDPIKIVDTATGLNSMVGYVTSYTASTGVLVCQIGCTFQFEIRRHGPRFDGSGYIPYFDFGVPDEYGPLISAALGTGIQYIDIGVIQITVPESIFKQLRGGTYQAALTVTDSVNTRQVFVAGLPVVHGGVSN